MAFINRVPVRFPDVDYARVLYFPRFFDYCHRTFEDLFQSEGLPYAKLIQEQNLGFPTVHSEADFRAPLKFGDVARIELEVLTLGERSVTCRHRLFVEATGVLSAEVKIVSACIDIKAFRGTDIPEHLRQLFGRYLANSLK